MVWTEKYILIEYALKSKKYFKKVILDQYWLCNGQPTALLSLEPTSMPLLRNFGVYKDVVLVNFFQNLLWESVLHIHEGIGNIKKVIFKTSILSVPPLT